MPGLPCHLDDWGCPDDNDDDNDDDDDNDNMLGFHFTIQNHDF